MVRVVSGIDVLHEARKVAKEPSKIILAVSYWGKGAVEQLQLATGDKDVHVVLNVEHGGTNPEELRSLMEVFKGRVRVHPDLHAKMYTSEFRSLVGSSNASGAGLRWSGVGHLEAAVVLEGVEAGEAWLLASEIYQAGEDASDYHVEICRRQFGNRNKTLAATLNTQGLAHGAHKAGALETLLLRDDVFGAMPMIITDGDVDDADVRREWADQRDREGHFGEEASYDKKVWTYFDWRLDARYDGRVCVDIHKENNRHFSLRLARPIISETGRGTFARRLAWSELGNLGRHWQGMVRNVHDEGQMLRAHQALSDLDYLTGWDLFEQLV
ncbi:phospholipase D family protein [Salipiger bermudensis]|uniref:phospholipase D family protein n=1 Tax=Salipiger bermudensis TaxID=344736 RepID=UPI001A8C6484|nr:phospholipase D family protein [Salipiger bermudensis]MBN9678772.1 phospholipase D family protein [Salipiger bermudensis]